MQDQKVSSVQTMSEENERLLGFSDALFAIALTFLALELGTIPTNLDSNSGPTDVQFLLDHVRDYEVYFGVFIVVGIFWLRHHSVFRYVKRTSGWIVWLNIAILALVAALPYPAGMLAKSDGVPAALLAMLVPLFVISVLIWLLWEIALRQGLVIPGLPHDMVVNVRAQLLVAPVILALALVVGWVAYLQNSHTYMRAAELLWLLLIFTPILVNRMWPSRETSYEVDESDLSDEWRSYADAREEQEEQSRSVLSRIRSGSDTDRLVVLTDGIVAIAATILALQLQPPDVDVITTNQQVLDSLQQVPMWTYWTTFVYIALFWIAHVRVFSHVRGANYTVLWLNLLFLMFVSFIPMPSALLAVDKSPVAAALYLATLFLTSLCLFLTGTYATYRLGLPSGLETTFDHNLRTLRSASLLVGFFASFVLVLVFQDAVWSNFVWIFIIAGIVITKRLDRARPDAS